MVLINGRCRLNHSVKRYAGKSVTTSTIWHASTNTHAASSSAIPSSKSTACGTRGLITTDSTRYKQSHFVLSIVPLRNVFPS